MGELLVTTTVTIKIERDLLELVIRELTSRQYHIRHRIQSKNLTTGVRASEYRKHDEIQRFKEIVKEVL